MAARRLSSSSSSSRRSSAYFTVFVSLLLLATVPTTNAAKKRLSRDDLAAAVASPIKQAAEAPLGDNIATASDSEPVAVAVAAPNASAPSADATAENPTTATDELDANFQSMMDECDPDMIGFEIITGYVFSAPAKLLDSMPGTLMLTDCLEACQSNDELRRHQL